MGENWFGVGGGDVISRLPLHVVRATWNSNTKKAITSIVIRFTYLEYHNTLGILLTIPGLVYKIQHFLTDTEN